MTQFAPEITIPAEVPDLAGRPRTADRVFFAPPPEQIGPLFRAESSLKAGKRPMSAAMRLVIAGLCCIPSLFFVYLWIVNARNDPDAAVMMFILFVVTFLLGLALPLYLTRFRATCAYVGQLGATRYTLKGKLENKPAAAFIDFQGAAELRTAQTRHFVNGVYTGTTYNFTWTNPQGRRLLTLKGQHKGKDGLPKPGDPFHFALASELAWSMFLLNRADAELAEHGALSFRIDAKKAVVIGPGFIEFHFNGRVDRCEAQDIKTISLSQGAFSIHHRDAKWYSSKGKFSFPYGNMANARLFLLTLDRFLPPSTWAQH
jgi:hypothetical protein